MSETAELIELPARETALEVFTDNAKLNTILDAVRGQVIGTVYDMTKRKDREACASDAYKVARCKSAFDKLRAAVSAELKELPKKVDAGGRYLKEGLEAIQRQVRAPLDEWEQREAERVQRHTDGVQRIAGLAANCGETSQAIRAALAEAEAVEIGPHWEEYETEAASARDKAVAALRDALKAREQYEADQAELARLRAEAAERAQRDREEQIAREAAERAQREAEAKAQAERAAAIQREQALRLAAERAEREKAEAIARAERERQDAIERERQAIEAERRRVAEEQRKREAEAKQREADRAHRAAVNRKALDAFVAKGLSEDCARAAVVLIASGQIPAVTIHY